jgi:ABC-type Na+ efflux pump permease subunit
MTEKLIFDVAISMFMLVPVFYGVGSIFNSYIASRIDSNRSFSYIPSAICLGIGLLNYFNPSNSVQKFIEYFVIKCTCCFSNEPEESVSSEVEGMVKRKKERL